MGTSLGNDGRWRFVTESGTQYLLDLGQSTLTRVVDTRFGWAPGLRLDEQPVRVIEVVRLRVGERATFLLSGLADDDVATLRETSPVLVIERVPPPP